MTNISLEKTEESARNLFKVLVCANCKEGSEELQFLGTICKHAFCWSCVNSFSKSRETICSLCLSMIEPSKSYPANIINEFASELSKFVELIDEYKTAVQRVGSFHLPLQATQRVTQSLLTLENTPRRNIEDFISSTQKDLDSTENTPRKARSRSNSLSETEADLISKPKKGRRAEVLAPIAETPETQKEPKNKENIESLGSRIKPKRPTKMQTPLTRRPVQPMLFMTQEMENLREEMEIDFKKSTNSPSTSAPNATRSFQFDKEPSLEKEDEPKEGDISPILSPRTPPSPELGEMITPPKQKIEKKEKMPETLERKAPRRSLTYKKKKFELIIAVQEHPAIAEKLIKNGYDVNESNAEQCTPLYFAAMKGYLKICKLLVENGALINAHCSKECNTPLHIAVKHQHSDVVDYLLSKGANKTVQNLHGQLPAEMTDFASPVRKMVAAYAGRPIQPRIPAKLPDVFVVFIHNIKMSSMFLERFKDLVRCDENLTTEVTHVVMMPSEQDKEIFDVDIIIIHAMLRGLTIVKSDWIMECLGHNALIRDTTGFEVSRTRFRDLEVQEGICRKYRMDKQQLPRLFQGCIFYVLSSRFRSYGTRTAVNDIIRLAGGELTSKEPKSTNENPPPPYFRKDLKTPYFILYDTDAKISDRLLSNPSLHKVSPLWLFECLTKYSFLDPY